MADGGEARRLWRIARKLSAQARGGKRLPPLFFFTDPGRTPDPAAALRSLPPGAGVVFRPFGAAGALQQAETLRRLAQERRLSFLVGADFDLAAAARADGLHLPERLASQLPLIRAARPGWLLTVAAHSRGALRSAERFGADAAFLSPVFASRSPSAGAPLGVRLARRWIAGVDVPVYALGGVDSRTAKRLPRTGFAGLAAVEALAG